VLESDQFLIIDQLRVPHHHAVVVPVIAGHQAGPGAGLEVEDLTVERSPHPNKFIDQFNAQFIFLTPNAHFILFNSTLFHSQTILFTVGSTK